MVGFTITKELIVMLIPIIIIQYSISIYCVIDILKKGTINLSQTKWIFIVLIGNLFGSIIYLSIGRKKDY